MTRKLMEKYFCGFVSGDPFMKRLEKAVRLGQFYRYELLILGKE